MPGRVGQRLLRHPVHHQLPPRRRGRAARGRSVRRTGTPLCAREVRGQRGQCAVRPRSSSTPGRSRRATRRTSSRLARALSRTSDSSGHQFVRRPGLRPASSPSSTTVRLCPTSSCSSWAIRCRSASCAASACARAGAALASSRSSIALKLRASPRPARRPPPAAVAGPRWSMPSMVPDHPVQGARLRPQQQRVGEQHDRQSDRQHDGLGDQHPRGDAQRRDHQHQRADQEDRPVDQADLPVEREMTGRAHATTLTHGWARVHARGQRWGPDPIQDRRAVTQTRDMPAFPPSSRWGVGPEEATWVFWAVVLLPSLALRSGCRYAAWGATTGARRAARAGGPVGGSRVRGEDPRPRALRGGADPPPGAPARGPGAHPRRRRGRRPGRPDVGGQGGA